ncbi:MAG: DUF4126 domain-containing protein [Akkermansia sp.]|nr:DUF4126 domain-containing protein [Akkermansia sp.]
MNSSPDFIQLAIALCAGFSLSAACGFRIFVPLLAMALSARFAGLSIDSSFAWVTGDAAILTLSVATIAEILAYYIPLFDNLLDSIAVPGAILAGGIVSFGLLGDMPEWLQWSVSIIGGSGAAGSVQMGTTTARTLSSAGTAGAANPIISTLENILSIIGTIMAVFLPILAAIGALVFIIISLFFMRRIITKLRRKKQAPTPTTMPPVPPAVC